MHFTQAVIGGAAVVGVLQFAVIEPVKRVVMPAPPPIEINALELRQDTIIQDRTIHTDAKFTAVWSAEIRDARGNIVPGCEGTGVWSYAPGRQAVELSVAEWVGDPNCRLGAGRYQAVATYEAGSFRATARSPMVDLGGGL
jgi:hypothetical protein